MVGHKFTHSCCALCWHKEHPGWEPAAVAYHARQREACCLCGEATDSGIYIRRNPQGLHCQREVDCE